MTHTVVRHGRLAVAASALLTAALLPGLVQLPAAVAAGPTPGATHAAGVAMFDDSLTSPGDRDLRGAVQPSDATA